MFFSVEPDHLIIQHIGSGHFAMVSRFVRPLRGSLAVDEITLRFIHALIERPSTADCAAAAAGVVIPEGVIATLIAFGIITPDEVAAVSAARRRVGIRHIVVEAWGGLGDALAATVLYERGTADGFSMFAHAKGSVQRHKRGLFLNNPHISGILTGSVADTPAMTRDPAIILSPQYAKLKPNTHGLNAVSTIGRLCGLDTRGMSPSLFLSTNEEAFAAALVRKYGQLAVLQVHSAGPLGLKDLPVELCKAVVQGNSNVTWLQVGVLRERLVPNVVDLRGIGLRKSFAAIQRASVFVGPDSVFAHAAGAFGIPAVVAFGPSSVHVAGYPTATNVHMNKPCAPCLDRPNVMMFCRNNYCMKDIPEKAFVARVAATLRGEPPSADGQISKTAISTIASMPTVLNHHVAPARSPTYALYDKLYRIAEFALTPTA